MDDCVPIRRYRLISVVYPDIRYFREQVQNFTTDFTFQINPAAAKIGDGMTFAIQNKGLTARGGVGGGLGYKGVKPSVAVKFDTSNNSGEGVNSTGAPLTFTS